MEKSEIVVDLDKFHDVHLDDCFGNESSETDHCNDECNESDEQSSMFTGINSPSFRPGKARSGKTQSDDLERINLDTLSELR